MTPDGHANYHDPGWDNNVSTEPWAIVRGPDGYVWVTEYATNRVQKLTSADDIIMEFSILSTGNDAGMTSSEPEQIVVGSDRNLWFTKFGATRSAGSRHRATSMSIRFQPATDTLTT